MPGPGPCTLARRISRGPHRLARSRTPPFQGGSTGSNPVGATEQEAKVKSVFSHPRLVSVEETWDAYGTRADPSRGVQAVCAPAAAIAFKGFSPLVRDEEGRAAIEDLVAETNETSEIRQVWEEARKLRMSSVL